MNQPTPDASNTTDDTLRRAIRQSNAFDAAGDMAQFNAHAITRWRETVGTGRSRTAHPVARWVAATALGLGAVVLAIGTLQPQDAALPASVGRVDVLSEMSFGGL